MVELRRSGDALSVGLIGLGYWGPNFLRILADRYDVRVDWICDLHEDRLDRFTRRYPGVRPTTRFEDLLDAADVDAVLIATPVFTHFGLASASLRAGKHTLVEKPLASSTAEAEDLLKLSAQCGSVLMCGHTFLHSPPVKAVKRILDRGELGDVYYISSSRVNLGLHQKDVSVLWDLGPHDFSILRYWLEDQPCSISAVGRDSIVEGISDVAFVSLQFPSGTLANLEISWLAPSKLRRTVLVGSQRMIVYEDGAAEPVRIFDHGVVYKDPESFGEYQLSYRTGDIVSPKVEATEPLAIELDDFITAVRRGHAPPGHVELSRDVVQMVEAAEASLLERGKRIVVGGEQASLSG